MAAAIRSMNKHLNLVEARIREAEETPKDDNDENESEHQVDLDTRLKMLMKNKSGGAMPSFLLNELNGSEEDDSDKEIKDLMLKNEDSRSSLPNSSILLPQHQAGKNLSIFLTDFC